MKKRSENGTIDEPMSDGGRYVNNFNAKDSGFFRAGKLNNAFTR